ncbi:MAG: hypothetical protein Q9169_003552, partial [Polycauliona sp. 2 TL-2023]
LLSVIPQDFKTYRVLPQSTKVRNPKPADEVNMKFINVLTLLASAMAVAAAPAAIAEAGSAPVAAAAPLEARDLTRGQCRTACDKGADAVEKFCRLIPLLPVRAACWGAAAAVETPIGLKACTSFCDNFF